MDTIIEEQTFHEHTRVLQLQEDMWVKVTGVVILTVVMGVMEVMEATEATGNGNLLLNTSYEQNHIYFEFCSEFSSAFFESI